MSAPYRINLGNLAEHAVPLGMAINRWLAHWSPWHLRHAEGLTRLALADALRRAHCAEAARHEMREYVEAYHPADRFVVPCPELAAQAWREPQFDALRIDLRSRQMSYVLTWGDMLLLLRDRPYVQDMVADKMAEAWGKEARRFLLDFIEQAERRQPRAGLAASA